MADDNKVTLDLDLNTTTVKPALKTAEDLFKKSGEKSGSNFSSGFGGALSSFTKSIFSIKSALISVGAAIGTAFAVGKLVDAANKQEDAVKRLNTSLISSGKFSEQASNAFQDFASKMQVITAVGDEVILENAAVIQSLGGLTEKGLERATRAAIDMSSALGVDLASSAVLVGKAATGEVGSFSRYGLAIKKASDNTETFNNALDAIERKFGGAAQRNAQTFSGVIKSISNSFGDLQEEMGFSITKSDKVIAGLNGLNRALIELGKYVKDNKELIMSLVSDGFVLLVTTFKNTVIAGAELIKFFKTASYAIDDFRNKLADNNAEKTLDEQLRNAVEKPGTENSLKKKLEDRLNILRDSNEQTRLEADANLQKSLASIDKFISTIVGASDGITGAIDSVKNKSTEMIVTTTQSFDYLNIALSSFGAGFSSVSSDITSKLSSITDSTQRAAEATKIAVDGMSSAFSKLGAESYKSLAVGVAGGFSAMGKALVTGENLLESFGKAFIAAIGQMAIQQGASFMLTGAGYLWVPGMQSVGSALIGAGAALSVFGGAMSALGGGGGGTAQSAQTNTYSPEAYTTPTELANIEKQPTLNVNIQGNYIDSEEAGSYLVDAINKAISGSNVKINQRAFA